MSSNKLDPSKLDSLLVKELKQLLQERNLSTTGKKKDLVNRLKEYLTKEKEESKTDETNEKKELNNDRKEIIEKNENKEEKIETIEPKKETNKRPRETTNGGEVPSKRAKKWGDDQPDASISSDKLNELLPVQKPEEKPKPPPQTHEPSETLHIINFVRPCNINSVKEMLSKTGKIKAFWMDKIRSHCYVQFETVEEATKTLEAVCGVKWGAATKYLEAYYVDASELQKKLDEEKNETKSTRQQEQKDKEQNTSQLQKLFRLTKAEPHIYYLPLTDEEVAKKKERERQRMEARSKRLPPNDRK